MSVTFVRQIVVSVDVWLAESKQLVTFWAESVAKMTDLPSGILIRSRYSSNMHSRAPKQEESNHQNHRNGIDQDDQISNALQFQFHTFHYPAAEEDSNASAWHGDGS